MVDLKHSDIRTIEEVFSFEPGYVLNFSDRTFAEFFEDEFDIDIDDGVYRTLGNSKGKRLRRFIEREEAPVVGYVLRALWEYRVGECRLRTSQEQEDKLKERFFALVSRIEGDKGISRTDALERFKKDHTLDELILAIERDISAHKPAAALDRMHTYCMKKFAHLLEGRGQPATREEALHARVGRYIKFLESERELREMSKRIIKSSISVFEQFNHVRNDRTLAHDNDILDEAEARFIFEGVSAFLRFLKTVDAARFGS